MMPARVRLAICDPSQELFLSLFPKAVQGGHAPFPAGLLLELGDRRDSQAFAPQRGDLFWAQTGDLQHLDQSRLNRGFQAVQEFEPTGRMKLRDLCRECLADPLHGLEGTLRDKLLEIRPFRAPLIAPRPGRIGPDLERVLPP